MDLSDPITIMSQRQSEPGGLYSARSSRRYEEPVFVTRMREERRAAGARARSIARGGYATAKAHDLGRVLGHLLKL